MTRSARHIAAFAAVAAIIAADIAAPAPTQAQSDDEIRGRIIARLLEDGRVEFGWQPTAGQFGLPPIGGYPRILPRQRYFPADAQVSRWLNSSPVESDGAAIGRINARLLDDGRIEFGFTPTDGERILTDGRYFPADARPNRWLRSTEIAINAPSPFIAVSANAVRTCGVRENGALECWGFKNGEQIDTPEGSFTAVSVGYSHTCAIHDTGELECWGRLQNRLEYTPPEGSYIAVAAGGAHTCAIAETFAGTNTAPGTGEVECWGDRSRRAQLYEGGRDGQAWVGRYRAISAAAEGTCGIRDTGELECWGTWGSGQVGGDAVDNRNNVLTLAGPPDGRFTAVSATEGYTCGIRDTGELECWGSRYYPITPPEGSYIAVAAGVAEACAIREDKTLTCWISDNNNAPGSYDEEQTDTPTGSFTAVSVGYIHTCGLRTDGEIECWGSSRDWTGDPIE